MMRMNYSFALWTTAAAVVLAAACTLNFSDAFVMTPRAMTPHQRQHQQQQHPVPQLYATSLEDLTTRLVADVATTASGSAAGLLPGVEDPSLLIGGAVAVVVLGVIGVLVTSMKNKGDPTSSSSSSSTSKPRAAAVVPKPEPVDISIPYDAPALLAYQRQVNAKGSTKDAEFESFKQMYKEVAVAEVVVKSKQQKLQALQAKFAEKYPSSVAAVNGASSPSMTVNGDVTKEETVLSA